MIMMLFSACSKQNLIQMADMVFEEDDIKPAVQFYNEHRGKTDPSILNEIDNLIYEHMEKLLLNWDESDETYERATNHLKELIKIDNAELSQIAKEKYKYLQCEYSGNELIMRAEEAYKQQDYLAAMQFLNQANPDYSQYQLFVTLYNDSKQMLLNKVGNPATISEYESAIKTLDGYLVRIEDEEFRKKHDLLQGELRKYREIYSILSSATELYEKEQYKTSFDKLQSGLQKYPDNNKIEYALSAYQYVFLMTICSQVIDYMENEQYDLAESLLSESIEIYDCIEFQELLSNVRMKTDILYALSTKVSEAGDYIFKSGKKMVLGDFAEDEQETLLSLGGSVTASIVNVDVPLDVRDLAYDIKHWGEGDYFAARLALDAVGVLPVIGALKYIKHLDTATDVVKGTEKVADTLDTAHDIAKGVDSAGDLIKNADALIDTAEVVADVKKKADTVADLTDDFSDFVKKADSATDSVEAVVKHYDVITTWNQSLLGMKHPNTGVEFIRNNLDLSDGRHLTGVFPKFDSYQDIMLPDDLFKASSKDQINYLSKVLKEQASTPSGRKILEKKFDPNQIEDILNGVVPEGLTWHHNEKEGLMQLVDTVIHVGTHHTGGMSIWGVGY